MGKEQVLPDKMGRGFARILSTGWFRVAIVRLSTGGVIMYRVSARINPLPPIGAQSTHFGCTVGHAPCDLRLELQLGALLTLQRLLERHRALAALRHGNRRRGN